MQSDGPDEARAPQHAAALQVARVSLAYIRDTILLSQGDSDLIDALLFTAALDANMAPVDRAPDLAVAYGGVDSSAPDDMRRPVSMHAVAQSLGLPVETVRRRFSGLVARGACLSTPAGIVVPREAVIAPTYKAIQARRYRRAQQLYADLLKLSVEMTSDAGPPPAEPLVRAANRVLSEYMLRACQALLKLTGDVLSALVLIQLVLENTARLDDARGGGWLAEPLRVAVPQTSVQLAAGLPISRETVRRRLRMLGALGFCQHLRTGWVAVAPPGAASALRALVDDNAINVERLFRRLSKLGVLAAWTQELAADRQPPHPRGSPFNGTMG